MILDSSALVAIVHQESDARRLFDAIEQAPSVSISAATFVETAVVIDSRHNPVASRKLDDFCNDIGLAIVPLDEAQARIARQAYRDFGKGSGHKAHLNLGDCFAYALAKATGEPLLFKGRDFAHAGVVSALE
ncbi:MAG TPA: type II toxin-antitoxin system VapC family toxin [Rhizomicrobium sp.]|jgi:ribonuclease VapC